MSLNRLSWARLASDLGSPPVVLTVLAWFAAQYDAESTGTAWMLAGLFILGAVVIPFAMLGWWVHRGLITDIHMPQRRERYWPLFLELSCTFLVWIVLRLIGSFPAVDLVTVFLLLETLIGLCVTVYWQISVHSGIITGAVIIAGLLFGAKIALTLSPLVLLVAAARLHLKRHTVSQVVAGIVAGIIVPLAYWMLVPH
ncbi:MAG: hypothetical protein K8I30_16510 [Anaerolineae bacterium]|nr:hypothetical protein [Anaerolineae bacterium]